MKLQVAFICYSSLYHIRPARHFICRELLSANTMDAAHQILKGSDTGAADGFSVNMIFMRKDGDYLFQNAEVGPAEDSNETPMSIVTLSLGEHFLHTNK